MLCCPSPSSTTSAGFPVAPRITSTAELSLVFCPAIDNTPVTTYRPGAMISSSRLPVWSCSLLTALLIVLNAAVSLVPLLPSFPSGDK